jgi:hypothetical protein
MHAGAMGITELAVKSGLTNGLPPDNTTKIRIALMKTNSTAQDSCWNVSFWFAVSSPLLGVLVGILAAAIFCR